LYAWPLLAAGKIKRVGLPHPIYWLPLA